MAEQFVVVAFPYSHLTPEAVGPFRSRPRAAVAAERIEAKCGGRNDWELAPQVVPLRTVAEFLDEFADPEPHDSEETTRG